MAKRPFTKAALTASELIEFLEAKGLSIPDHSYATHYLSYVGYYRLKIYMKPFQNPDKNFQVDATFEQIVEVYEFDRKLRLLCLDAIERIEVSLRAHLINVMSLHGGPHFYYDTNFFRNITASENVIELGEEGNHLSISYYKKHYDPPALPPIWCLTEASTFGQLSRCYADLLLKHRKEIAKGFGFSEPLCVSWIRSLVGLRNICAHHGRLWNAEMKVDTPKKIKKSSSNLLPDDLSDNTRCYARLAVLRGLLNCIDFNGFHTWTPRLKELIANRPDSVELSTMGFPAEWEERPLWT